MEYKNKIEKLNDFWLRCAGVPTISIFLQLTVYAEDRIKFGYPLERAILVATIVTIIIWETGRQILIYFRKKYPEINQTRKRVLFSLIFFLLGNLIICFFTHWFYNYYLIWNHILAYDEFLFDTVVATCFVCLIYGVYEMIYFYRKWEQTYSEREKLLIEKTQSQLDALRSQINPHFLFNSLNTLEALTEEKHENSTQFVRELANVYRFILQSQDKKLNTLKEELDFISAYSFLLKTRFGDNLTLTIAVEECDHVKQLPPLTLQLLVENAMKHNIISSTKPLHIKITSVENNFLAVTNKLQKKSQTIASTKIGLNNISQRYQILGERKMAVEETAHEFKVTVPLIEETP